MFRLIKSYSAKLHGLLIEILFIGGQYGKSFPQANILN